MVNEQENTLPRSYFIDEAESISCFEYLVSYNTAKAENTENSRDSASPIIQISETQNGDEVVTEERNRSPEGMRMGNPQPGRS